MTVVSRLVPLLFLVLLLAGPQVRFDSAQDHAVLAAGPLVSAVPGDPVGSDDGPVSTSAPLAATPPRPVHAPGGASWHEYPRRTSPVRVQGRAHPQTARAPPPGIPAALT